MRQTATIGDAVGRGLSWAGDRPPERRLSVGESEVPPVVAGESRLWVQDVYLECTSQPLHEQLAQGLTQGSSTTTEGAIAVRVIPVFLLAGTHVMQDIPAEIALWQDPSHVALPFTLTPHLGSHVGLRRLLNERLSLHPMEAWILLAHGSKREGANAFIEQLADHVGAVTAYWSTAPSLAERVAELQAIGLRRIGILPYFLFPGGITDAIAQTVTQLTQQWPHLNLTLTDPLAASQAELADLLVDLATTAPRLPSERGSIPV